MASFEPIIVGHYGIHRTEGGIAFLEQQKGGTNAIGLREKSPFKVHLQKRYRPCNHLIPLAAPNPDAHHMEVFGKIYNDPLVQAMLPIPRNGVKTFYCNDPHGELNMHLVNLSRLSSPIHSIVTPLWTVTMSTILEELTLTNVQPLVLTTFQAKDSQTLSDLSQAALFNPRTVVCTGAEDVVVPVVNAKRITTRIHEIPVTDLMGLPLESIGAVLVRKYMRKEWDLSMPLPDIVKEAAERRAARATFQPKR